MLYVCLAVCNLAMGLLILGNLVKLVTGRIADSDLIQVHDSEDDAVAHVPTDLKQASK